MFNGREILDEKDKRLREVSSDVIFPLSDEDKKLIDEMIEHLTISQKPELAEKYDVRPGMGLAAIQLGINKRYFVVVEELEDGSFKNHIVINPKIVSNSEEIIFAASGEGCLSVNREIDGIVPRFARVSVSHYDVNGNKVTTRVREEAAIAYQHEIDHLNGILFFDRIDKKDPYKNMDQYREL